MKKEIVFVLAALLMSTVLVSAADDPDIRSFYATPSQPHVGMHFDIYVRAEDNDGIERIRLYDGTSLEYSEYCDGDDDCRIYFDMVEYTSGYHRYRVKVYDEDGDTESETISVYIRSDYDGRYRYYTCGDGFCSSYESCSSCPVDCGPCNYCGDGSCNGAETCSSCSKDCGPCSYCGNGICSGSETCSSCPLDCGPCSYCGNGICSGSETCSSCPSDCGSCDYCGDGVCSGGESCLSCKTDCGGCVIIEPPKEPQDDEYTCKERGGSCCAYGGSGVVEGASDCPASCYTECNDRSESPSGAFIAADGTLMIFGALVVILFLLVALLMRQ